jgi:uncharacterized protein (TIGR02271 family)
MDEQRIPVIEEQARIDKQVVERSVVKINTFIKERQETVSTALLHEEVDIERVPMNVQVSAMPEVRFEGEVIIIPVVEERVVVSKRLILTEELRVNRKLVEKITDLPVTLRSTEVSVHREGSSAGEPHPQPSKRR